jgi:hypothetical protein
MTERERDAFELFSQQVGLAVLACQLTERMLRACIVWALPRDSKISLTSLTDLEGRTRRKTLGILVRVLRKEWQLPPGFAATLDKFLEHRNILVHELLDVAGPRATNSERIRVGTEYASRVRRKTEAIRETLSPFVERWAQRATEGGSPRELWAEYESLSLHEAVDSEAIRPAVRAPANRGVERTGGRGMYDSRPTTAAGRSRTR